MGMDVNLTSRKLQSDRGHRGIGTATQELLVPCGKHQHAVIVALSFWRGGDVVFNPCDALGETARRLTGSTCQAWLGGSLGWANEWLEVVYAGPDYVLNLESWSAMTVSGMEGLPWESAEAREQLARDILGEVEAAQLVGLVQSDQPEQVWASLMLMNDRSFSEFGEMIVWAFDDWSRPLQLAAIDCLLRLRQDAGLPLLYRWLADESAHIAMRSAIVQTLIEDDELSITSPLVDTLESCDSDLSYVVEQALREAVDRAGRDCDGVRLVNLMQSGLEWLERDAGLYLSRMGEAAIPHLAEVADAGDQGQRLLVVAALAEIGPAALDTLLSILHDSRDALVRESVARALGRLGRCATLHLVDLLADPHDRVARQAARSLEQISDPSAASGLVAALCRDDVRDEVTRALRAILAASKRDASAVPLMLDLLKARETFIANSAATILGEIGDPQAKRPLIEACLVRGDVAKVAAQAYVQFATLSDVQRVNKLLKHGDQVAAQGAVEIMVAVGKMSVPTLLKGLSWTYCETRRFSAQALGRIADPSAVVPLIGLLNDAVPSVRLTALEALGQIGDPRADDRIRKLRSDADPLVRRAAMSMDTAGKD